jgi:hypothetical protein
MKQGTKTTKAVQRGLGFHRYSTGVRLGRYAPLPADADADDDIMVGLYGRDGSCDWEFKVESRIAGSGKAIRVCVFDDAFKAFTSMGPFFRWMSLHSPRTLDAVQDWLRAFGVRDMFVSKPKKA